MTQGNDLTAEEPTSGFISSASLDNCLSRFRQNTHLSLAFKALDTKQVFHPQ